MATVSSLGIGSGVDLNSLLSKLVAAESTPITQLNTKQTSYKSQLSAYGRIKSAMEKLATAAENIGSETKFKGFTATVADTGYASATATSFAAKGTFDLRVEQLAQANKLQSGINPTVSAGTLQIELGDISGGSFVAKGGYTPVTVNFTGSTLEDLRSAINDADAGVTATIVNGTNGKQLVLTSNETGVENTVRLTGTGGLSGLTYNPLAPSAAFTEKSAAQDAEAYLDGVLVSSSTNTISEAMTGVSITLKKAHDPLTPTDQTTLTIGADSEGMSTRAKDFTTAWNELNSLFKELTKFDTTNNKASTLTGDASVGGMGRQLRDILFSSPAAASSELPRLSDLGITLGADGSLSLDATDFENAVASNLTAVTATITAFGASFQTTAENFLDTDGIITTRQDSLNTIIANLDDRREELQRRVDAIEARYRAQFTALDTLMSRMQTQSTYLTQQLAALSG